MPLTNQSKPTTSLSNSSKVSIGETWATITTTWASETRTWLAVSQLITNVNLNSIGILWSPYVLPWQLTSPWTTVGSITNISKPS